VKAISPTTLVILFICTALSSCIEFENQELIYHHDEEKDEIRMTLNYQGIFGNLDKGQNTQNNPEDMATKDRLNQKQISQLESVLEQKRAFFFSNWIFEYDPRALSEILTKDKPTSKGSVFGKPEKELIQSLIKEIKVENVGFYKNEKGQLCAAQTFKISNSSHIIAQANEMLGRQLKARIQEMREERNKKVPSAFTTATIDLIETKVRDDFPFIKIQGNLITITLIMTPPDQERISKSTLKDLPKGARIEFQDEALLIKIGTGHAQQSRLSKKCFEGYWPNALNHIQATHKKLMRKPRKVESRLKKFLSGTD
tara:strand:- start:2730 stop:3668 length:939 start_codon:yes stop_codon:yes gene_type:complete